LGASAPLSFFMDKKSWFVIILILMIGVMTDRDPLFWKEFSLTLGGAICLAIVLWHRYRIAAVLALVMVYHMARPEGMQFWSTSIIAYIACFLGIAYLCRDYVSDRHIKWAICIAGILQGLYAILQVFYEPLYTLMAGYGPEFRVIGTTGNKQYLLMFLFACIPVYFHESIPALLRKSGLVIVGLALMASWGTTHEIGYCEAGAALAGLVWLLRKGIKPYIVCAIFAVCCLAVVLIIHYEPKRVFIDPGPGGGPGYYVFASETDKFLDNIKGGVESRWVLYKMSWNIIRHRPWLGYGLGTYILFEQNKKVSLGQAHNEYLQMWAELGILGLVGSVSLLLFVLGKCLVTSDPAYYFSVLLIGLFSIAQFPLHLPMMTIFLLRGNKRR
jgi:hypothetical protein